MVAYGAKNSAGSNHGFIFPPVYCAVLRDMEKWAIGAGELPQLPGEIEEQVMESMTPNFQKDFALQSLDFTYGKPYVSLPALPKKAGPSARPDREDKAQGSGRKC